MLVRLFHDAVKLCSITQPLNKLDIEGKQDKL